MTPTDLKRELLGKEEMSVDCFFYFPVDLELGKSQTMLATCLQDGLSTGFC